MPEPVEIVDTERPRGRGGATPRRPGFITRARNALANLLERGGNNLQDRANANRARRN